MLELILTEQEKVNFPTLAKYPASMLGKAVAKLLSQGLTKEQAMVNLEQDLAELEQRSTGD